MAMFGHENVTTMRMDFHFGEFDEIKKTIGKMLLEEKKILKDIKNLEYIAGIYWRELRRLNELLPPKSHKDHGEIDRLINTLDEANTNMQKITLRLLKEEKLEK